MCIYEKEQAGDDVVLVTPKMSDVFHEKQCTKKWEETEALRLPRYKTPVAFNVRRGTKRNTGRNE